MMPDGRDRKKGQINKRRLPRIQINMGTIAFMLIVIYIMAYIVSYIGKDKMSIYEVSQSDIVDSIEGTGIALRKEKTVGADKEGYVYFFVKDGARVQKKALVYAVDTTGKVQAYVQQLLGKEENVSSEEKNRITDALQSFGDSFEDDEFSNVYDAHMNIDHELTSYTDTLLAKNRKEMEKVIGKKSYVEVKSPNEGIITFSSDGLESVGVADVSEDLFESHPRMMELRSKEKHKKGDPIYRIIMNQRWRLMIPVSQAHYQHLKEIKKEGRETLKITFDKDNFSTRVPFACKKNEDSYYVVLVFDNYVQRYMNQRYLHVKMVLSETQGLKIPTSSLVEKEVWKIPLDLLSKGGNSTEEDQVSLVTKKKDKTVLVQKKVKIYQKDDQYAYISMDGLARGQTLSDPERTQSLKLEESETLQGVYVVNRGFTVFRRIDILEKNDDYCIVSSASSEIELYDRIILNGNSTQEGRVIY